MTAVRTAQSTHVSTCLWPPRQENAPGAQSSNRLLILTCASLLFLVALACVSPAALAQANVQGQWVTLNTQMPINPIHLALMHNGKVLVVSGSGNLPSDTTYLAAVWDPATDTVPTQPVPFDMFCNGMVVLPDGRPFVIGGTQQYDPFHGDPQTAAYDPSTGNFVQLQSMADGRWYPTATTLSDGSVMIFSGLAQSGNTNTTIEIYKVGVGWSQPFAVGWTPPLYPRMHLLPNATVFFSGPSTGSAIFNPTTQTWQSGPTTNYSGTRTYGSSVLLPLLPSNNYKPVVMIMGGNSPATNTTELIDLSASNPKWVYGPNMSQPRIEMDAVILPNGKVLAVNGSINDEDTTTASLNADLYDPVGNTFSSAGANAFPRLYHSGALLLPDATVMVVGGNPSRGTYEPHVEIYSPAYLFNANGALATRPTITSVTPSVIGYGSSFQVQTPSASSISSVVLVRAGSPTHAFDMDQRLVGLNFTAGSGVLNVTAPPNGSIAPPGYYLLFVLNSSGVPSVAQFVQLSLAPTDQPPTGIITSPANNVAIAAGQSVSFAGTGTSQSGTIAAYSWAFPGGNPASSAVANPGAVTYSTAGTYVASLTVTDNSGVTDPSPPSRTVTVTVGQAAPAITSANSTTFTVGTAGSFTVTTTGSPAPSLGETGALPSGVTFKDNGNGTGTLSGTPASGTAGTYPLTFTASNGVGTAASQSFTLTVGNFGYVSGSVTGAVNASTSGSTLSVTLHQNPGAGHLLLCAATWQSSTAGASMSDPNNGTWKSVGSPKTGIGSLSGFRGQMFYVPSAVSASTTVTLTISSAVQFRAFECAEYSYSGTISSLDGTPQYSTTPASGGVATISGLTTSNASDLVFVDCLGVDTTCTAGSGYTGVNDNNTYDAGSGSFGNSFWGITGQMIEHKAGVAAGAQSATFGTGTATDNVILGLLAMTSSQVNQAPAITSANSTTFTVGTAGSFTVTATGSPTPSLSETGALPSGVTFKDNGNGTGTLSGTPASGTSGTYPLTFTASNGVGTAASQSFTLTVGSGGTSPAITSANSTTFTVGTAGSFTVTATGSPTPSLSETGSLPSGVTFKDNGNGTGTLSGTPASGTAGTYPLTFTASNGVGTAASQGFTLKVNQAPAITSANSTAFSVGTAGSFTVTATGSPTPSLSETGALPSGVTFKDNGNGTGTLSGTPASGTVGTYPLTFTASNGVGTAASQSFTLTVGSGGTSPAITSANSTTFTVGTAGSFTVTATGSPTPSLSETGSLPSGVTFKDNGNGAGTLSGTPASGTAGTYPLTFTASNGVGTAASQGFTLKVNQAPAITSANSTAFSVGTAGSFTVTATGSPTPSLSETGALPSGVTFKDNGNGTGTLSGTPASGTVGTYPLTFTASNGVGTAANQSFTLAVGSGGGGGPSNFGYVSGSVTGAVNASTSGSTLSVTLHQNPGAGHLLLCAATWQSSTASASMSDPNNGTWKSVGSPKTGIGSLSGFRGQMFYVPSAVSASTTVTLTISSAVQFRAFECAEYSYSGTISSLDGTPQYSTTPASGGVATISGLTTSNASDLVFVDCLGVDTTCAAGSGYTGVNDNNTYDAGSGSFGNSFWGITGQMIEHKVGVAAGAQSATFGTGTATDNVILGLLAF